MFKVRFSAFQLVYLAKAVCECDLLHAASADDQFDVSFEGMKVHIFPVKK